MIRQIITKTGAGFLALSILLTACTQTAPPQPTVTATETAMPTFTNTATLFPMQTSTATLTNTPTPEPSPTPSPTLRWEDQNLSLTPLPPHPIPLSGENLEQLRILALWGEGAAHDFNLSPDGDILAVGTHTGAFLYKSINFEFLEFLPTPFPVHSIAFSADNQLLALGQVSETIDIYQRDTYALLARLSFSNRVFPETYRITVDFSQDDSLLFSVVETQQEIYFNQWETNGWGVVGAFSISPGTAHFINRQLDLLGNITRENILELQSLAYRDDSTFLSLPTSISPTFWEETDVHGVEIAPSTTGKFLVLSNGFSIIQWELIQEDYHKHIWTTTEEAHPPCAGIPETCFNWEKHHFWKCDADSAKAPVSMITLSPSDFSILISYQSGRTEFRQIANGLLDWEINAQFVNVVFFPTGEFFIGQRPDGIFEKRATGDGTLQNTLKLHPTQLYDLRFSPDGSILAAGFSDEWIRVYSTSDGEMLGVLNGTAKSLQFSPDGQLLAAGLIDGTIRIFQLERGRYYDLGNGHDSTVTDLTFTTDGTQLLSGSLDCTVSLWGLGPRYRIQNTILDPVQPFPVIAVDISNAGLIQLAAGKQAGIFAINEAETSKLFQFAGSTLSDISLSPDEQVLGITGSDTWLLTAVSASAVEPILLTPQSPAEGFRLAFTPDGLILVITTSEGFIFWSVREASHLATIPFPKTIQGLSSPTALGISPDGTLIALGTKDGVISIYGISSTSSD